MMNDIENLKHEVSRSGLFDAEWYRKTYKDVDLTQIDPLEHFLRFGMLLERDPGPNFNTKFYIADNPDIAQAGTNALLHYIRTGKAEGRSGGGKDVPTSTLINLGLSDTDANFGVSKRSGTASSSQHWVWRAANDAFMLRGLRPLSSIAIAVNASTDKQWLAALSAINTTDFSEGADIFLIGNETLDFSQLPAFVRSVSWVAPEDEIGNAKGFVKLASSGALDDYTALLWLSPQDAGPDESLSASVSLKTKFLADPDWGCIGTKTEDVQSFGEPLMATLRTALPRLGLNVSSDFPNVVSGAAVWIRPLLLRSLGTTVRLHEMTAPQDNKLFPGRLTVLAVLSFMAHQANMKVGDRSSPITSVTVKERNIKAVAFYLPQFHPIPENDKWWGKGFTEWSNVVRGKPLFRGHYQPRVPADLGYYDLRLEDTLLAQTNLAREFGIHGFCYYYYWFNGKKLLNHPIEQMARSKQADTGFCVCWANENWSRNWDGQNRHVLLKQEYSLETNVALIRELIPMMKDPRWIRYNNRPVMMVYRISIIPNWLETARLWREECRKAGLGEIHLCAVRFGLERLEGQPQDFGLDSYVLFPPHEAARSDIRNRVHDLHQNFGGEIFDYTAVVDGDLEKYASGYDWPVHRGTMLAWDNTARRLTDARIFHGATPYGFRRWMKGLLEQENRFNSGPESLVFINAWNEWAEGTYLEPDQRWGRTNLGAIRSASQAIPGLKLEILPEGIATKPKVGEILEATGSPLRADQKSVEYPVWHKGERDVSPDHPTIMLCAHISGHQLYGGERSFLDVLEALSQMPVNVIVTLPSGNNKPYIESIKKLSAGIYVFRYQQWMDNRNPYAWLVNTFADIIARHKVNVVHVNTIVLLEPLLASKRMGCTSIVHSRELISLDDPLRERMRMSTGEIVSKIFENSDWVIGNSRATCALFSRGERTLYVPNAVHVKELEMDNQIKDAVVFGIVSSNIPKKGLSDFVEVARRSADKVPNARFVVIGPENAHTLAWTKEVRQGERPDNISFLGYRDTPRQSMAELNVLLNLSNFAESFGRTVAEAMAARRPVIAYDWGALSELVKDGETGYLVSYRDIDAVVDAVARFCEDKKLIASMGTAGHAFVKANFNQTNLRNALREGYSKILGRSMRKALASVKSEPAQHRPPSSLFNGTTIIVPVYNAPDEVRNCIRSIIRHTDLNTNRLIIINDGSKSPEIAPMLSAFSDVSGITVLINSSNIGYTRTINLGISEAGTDDVVLLNSDTIVTPRWLEGLRSAAYSRDKVATVTAMSDNAGAFSFPKFNAQCPKPDNMSHEEYAILLTQATQHCVPPKVPTGSGFCMYIRRALIDECGVFDHEGFPRGYGEENDFCMRAVSAGWVNLISPWSFVYHVRTASFKGEKDALVKAGVDVVTKRYPAYAAEVKAAFSSDTMLALRRASAEVV